MWIGNKFMIKDRFFFIDGTWKNQSFDLGFEGQGQNYLKVTHFSPFKDSDILIYEIKNICQIL